MGEQTGIGALDPRSRDLARHALGLPNAKKRSYRNRFLAAPSDEVIWRQMTRAGLAKIGAGTPIGHWFELTLDGANAVTIPNGYSRDKHAALKSTIAQSESILVPTGIMACHEYPKKGEVPCVGWAVNQLGPGNNIPVRMMFLRLAREGQDVRLQTLGEQHARFEDTLP